jgi:hypothetical protein
LNHKNAAMHNWIWVHLSIAGTVIVIFWRKLIERIAVDEKTAGLRASKGVRHGTDDLPLLSLPHELDWLFSTVKSRQ